MSVGCRILGMYRGVECVDYECTVQVLRMYFVRMYARITLIFIIVPS